MAKEKTFVFPCLLIFNVPALSHEKFNSCGGCLACEHHDHGHDQHNQHDHHDIDQVVVEELALADYVLVNRSCDQSVIANKFAIIVIDKLDWLHLFDFLHCVSSNVSSIGLLKRMHNRTGCTCLTFRRCVFSYVSSNRLSEWMQNHIGCISLIFLHCVFSYAPSKNLLYMMQSHTGCICLTFHHCVISNAS